MIKGLPYCKYDESNEMRDRIDQLKYLFICGCGHSGTTLMVSIFAMAERVHAIDRETSFLLEGNSVRKFKESYLPKNRNIKLVVEKTPRHVYHIKDICSDEASEALVIVRNPVDVVASLVKRGNDLDTAIQRYWNDNNQWIKLRQDVNFNVLKYEDLTNNTEESLSKLSNMYNCDLIHADYRRLHRPSIIGLAKRKMGLYAAPQKHDGTENHSQLRKNQSIQPIRNMNGEWRKRISQADLDIIHEKLEPMYKVLGYEECLKYSPLP
jgi:protein O-GlcNAc transferase